jgi:amino acid transporter
MTGVLLCMWNYMGWDNASTVAAEVERPQRNYPRAMLMTIVLVAGCYIVPVLCATASGIAPEQWTTGSWVEVGRRLGGPWLGRVIALGGVLCGLGMFNVLIMSYSRLPMAMARDGMLPRWLRKRDPRSGAPTRVILIGAVLYAACMGLGFRHLVEIDVLLYGAVLTLEFVSLVVLRVREPELVRPFRIRGGVPVIIAMSLLPLGLIGIAMYAGRQERALWGLSSLQLGAMILSFGPLLYAAQRLLRLGSRRDHQPGAAGAEAAVSSSGLHSGIRAVAAERSLSAPIIDVQTS